jgi:Na+/phosphate symporter
MKTNSGSILAALSLTGWLALLSSAAFAVQPIDTPEIRASAQNATTASDHEAVAKHYETVGAQVQAKLKEQKELLEQYQNKSYLYGRQAQDLQSHTEALIRDYEQTVAATVEEAATHRRIASKLQEKHASDTQRPNSVSGL